MNELIGTEFQNEQGADESSDVEGNHVSIGHASLITAFAVKDVNVDKATQQRLCPALQRGHCFFRFLMGMFVTILLQASRRCSS